MNSPAAILASTSAAVRGAGRVFSAMGCGDDGVSIAWGGVAPSVKGDGCHVISEVLSERSCDHGSGVTLTSEGVAADPHLLAGRDVRGEAEAGGVTLGHCGCLN